MKYYNEILSKCSVYPGLYVPNIIAEKTISKQDHKVSKKINTPFINFLECIDSYKMEIALPGIKRENLFLKTNEFTFSISVLSSDNNKSEFVKINIHEFDISNITREMTLPKDADTEFMNAEFHDGILYIHIPKSNKMIRNKLHDIIVY